MNKKQPAHFVNSLFVLTTFAILICGSSQSFGQGNSDAFQPIFNGENLDGWYAIKTYDPRSLSKMDSAAKAKRIADAKANTSEFWRVENGEIINDGKGPFLTSEREFGDFELLIEYKTVALADSGIYLKATPQVQIWDYTDKNKFKLGADKGSGGLWNNPGGSAGKDPLVLADNPFGEWNRVKIQQIGSRTSVWLNDKQVVDHAIMANYWGKKSKLPLIAKGPIQLQTHGGQIRWRNIYARELSAKEANKILASKNDKGFESIFNGTDLTGWKGPLDNYEVIDNCIRCKKGKGGTIHTEGEYDNFVARLEFKLPPGGNNGLAIRYPGKGDTAYQGMCELQVLDNTAEKFSKLDDRQYHGSAYGMVAAHRGYQRPVGEWNFQEVTVSGSKIKVELNGTIILDCDLNEASKFMADRPHPGKDRTTGYFGLAGHSDPVEFRNLEIKRLDKAP